MVAMTRIDIAMLHFEHGGQRRNGVFDRAVGADGTAGLWWLFAASVCLVVVLVLLVRQRHLTRVQRQRANRWELAVLARDDELRHLLDERLPTATSASTSGSVAVPGLRHEGLEGTAFADGLWAVLRCLANADAEAQHRANQAAQDAVRGIMENVTSLLKRLEWSLDEAQHRHDDPAVLRILNPIWSAYAEVRQETQACLVLCGSWVGQQRSAASLHDVVRSACSRQRTGDQRVQIAGRADVLVVGRAVEPLALALAELLQNALVHSPATAPVYVELVAGHHGWTVRISDAGAGMNAEQRRRAMRLLSGHQPVDITVLGEPPRIGLAVVARLSVEVGFHVEVGMMSPYGGTSCTVQIPHSLCTAEDPEASPPFPASIPASTDPAQVSAPGARPTAALPAPPGTGSSAPPPTEASSAAVTPRPEMGTHTVPPGRPPGRSPAEWPADELPQRQRRRPAPHRARGGLPAVPAEDLEQTAAAFQRARQGAQHRREGTV
jgi:signal transduction histidine kinase